MNVHRPYNAIRDLQCLQKIEKSERNEKENRAFGYNQCDAVFTIYKIHPSLPVVPKILMTLQLLAMVCDKQTSSILALVSIERNMFG